MEFLSQNLEQTVQIAMDFKTKLKPKREGATVVGLYGDLGSGKTTFMKYLAKAFGVEETVQSPTFVIEKIYELENQSFQYLIHIDCYRLEREEEMINLGWREIMADSRNLICIEWPEKVSSIMPEHIVVKFEHVSENQRKISFT